MDQLIPVINKLQDVFAAIGQETIDLPQITVVGSQSAGKSSVLENIVGRDFLPRGFGIVTRRPLVLQLYCINPDEMSPEELTKGEEWGEFLHLPGQKFHDFDEIRAEIIRETDRLTGRNKGVSKKSINLKIFSPYVLNLTLVDLPGITKVPTGDQPPDIEEKILEMCEEFISKDNAIILAVTAANQDLANSDGLKMARRFDPEGERTIGVLTKVDIMDHGTDCYDVLDNKVIPLKRGYIAVINRSQKDIQENLPIRKGLAKEQAFFQGHPKYRGIINRCGTKNLARTLSQILMVHIRDCLPEIKNKINKMLVGVQSNLDALGDSFDDQNLSSKGVALLRILSTFAKNVSNKIDGRSPTSPSDVHLLQSGDEMSELRGGARISYIFNEIFGKTLSSMDPFENLDDDDIRTAIANANGIRPALFVPEIAFDLLVRKQIKRLEDPGQQCLELVVDELHKMINQSESLELQRFPELRERTMDTVLQLLKSCVSPARKMIANLIEIELAYINTSHPDFIGGRAAAASAQAQRVKQQAQQQQQQIQQHVQQQQQLAQDKDSDFPPPAIGGPNNALLPESKGFQGMYNPSNSQSGRITNNAPFKASGLNSNGRLPMVPDKMRPTTMPTDKEKTETDIIKLLIRSYFDIVKKNFTDLVPKTIMRFLVFAFKENLQNELVAKLYKEQVMVEAMKENDDVASKRRAFSEMRDLLHRANEIVNEVRDFQPTA